MPFGDSDDDLPLHRVEDVRHHLARVAVNSEFDQKEFFTNGCLDVAILREALYEVIPDAVEHETQEDLKNLVDFIIRKGKTVLAISICCGLDGQQIREAMTGFLAIGFDDSKLPVMFDGSASPPSMFYSPTEKAYRKPWNYFLMKNFCFEVQWKFLAPVFSESRSQMRVNSKAILPFTSVEGLVAHGGSAKAGGVYRVTIHRAHQNRRDIQVDDRVAVKKMHQRFNETEAEMVAQWEKEIRAHQEITKPRHVNIIDFVEAISRGSEQYPVLEWADGGNLRDWWHDNEPHLTLTLVKDIIHQLYGLADALERIHQKNFRHGDIKPENILHVMSKGKRSGSSELDAGTLKICDMGLSKYHLYETRFRGPTST